jgi:hypothetical protein
MVQNYSQTATAIGNTVSAFPRVPRLELKFQTTVDSVSKLIEPMEHAKLFPAAVESNGLAHLGHPGASVRSTSFTPI